MSSKKDDGFREQAFLVCQKPNGEITAGAVVNGSWGKVSFSTRCPASTKPIGVMHTHPPGTSVEASGQDLAETRRRGLDFVCVGHRQAVKCYPVSP